MTTRIVPDDVAGRIEAVAALGAGALVALPTDTVYGLGVALDAVGGLGRLFAAKHRPLDRGIVLLLADHHQADAAGIMTPAAHVLAAAFWPGGLTLVVPQRAEAGFPPELTGGAATIGLRLPAHDAPRALAAAVGPLPVSSANRSGEPPAISAADVVASSATARIWPSSSMAGLPEGASRRRSSTVRVARPGSCAPGRSRPMSLPRSSTRRGSSTRSGDDPGRRSGRAGTLSRMPLWDHEPRPPPSAAAEPPRPRDRR